MIVVGYPRMAQLSIWTITLLQGGFLIAVTSRRYARNSYRDHESPVVYGPRAAVDIRAAIRIMGLSGGDGVEQLLACLFDGGQNRAAQHGVLRHGRGHDLGITQAGLGRPWSRRARRAALRPPSPRCRRAQRAADRGPRTPRRGPGPPGGRVPPTAPATPAARPPPRFSASIMTVRRQGGAKSNDRQLVRDTNASHRTAGLRLRQ